MANNFLASEEIRKHSQGVWLTNYAIEDLYELIEEYEYIGNAAQRIGSYLVNDRDILGRGEVQQTQNLLKALAGKTFRKTPEVQSYTFDFKGTLPSEVYTIGDDTDAGILKENPGACSVVISMDPIQIEDLHCILSKNSSLIENFKYECFVQFQISEGDTHSFGQFIIDMPGHETVDELYTGDLISLSGNTQ